MTTSNLTITIQYPSRLIAQMRAEFHHAQKRTFMRQISSELRGIIQGDQGRRAYVRTILASVVASGTAACVSVANDDTIVIGGTTLTAKTTGANGTTQFTRGVSDTADAAALAACINANTTLAKIVRASSALGVVTIYCLYPGPIGNLVTVTSTGGTITVPATLTSGASDAPKGFEFGYTP